MIPVVRAIDIGFGNTKYVAAAAGEKIDCAHFPSLAFHSTRDKSSDLIGGRRRTVAIPLDDMFYRLAQTSNWLPIGSELASFMTTTSTRGSTEHLRAGRFTT
jgi:hypothetical protein